MHKEVEYAVDAAIRITTWKNIKRYWILFAIFDLVITLSISLGATIIVAQNTRASDRRHAQVACANTATLARIEHVTVANQAAQTQSLVAKGFTFGLPKGQFIALEAKSAIQQQKFLSALDKLAKSNCKNI